MKIITLCGSTKFKAEFEAKNKELTLAGNVVISVACFGDSGDNFTDEQKVLLDEIHRRKIDLADAIYVINKNGYIGSSTRSEIEYAQTHGKEILYMETPANPCVSCDTVKVRCEECSKPKPPTHGSCARPPKKVIEIGFHIDSLKAVIRKEVAAEILSGLLEHTNMEISDSYEKSVKGSKHYGGVNNAYHTIKRILEYYAEKYGVEVK